MWEVFNWAINGWQDTKINTHPFCLSICYLFEWPTWTWVVYADIWFVRVDSSFETFCPVDASAPEATTLFSVKMKLVKQTQTS